MKFVLIFLIVVVAVTSAYEIKRYCGTNEWSRDGNQRDNDALVSRLLNHPVSVWVNDCRFTFPRLPLVFNKDLDLFSPRTQAELLMQSWIEYRDKYMMHFMFLNQTNYQAPLLHADRVDWIKVDELTKYAEAYLMVKDVIAEYVEHKTKCNNKPKRKFIVPCTYRHDFDSYQDYHL